MKVFYGSLAAFFLLLSAACERKVGYQQPVPPNTGGNPDNGVDDYENDNGEEDEGTGGHSEGGRSEEPNGDGTSNGAGDGSEPVNSGGGSGGQPNDDTGGGGVDDPFTALLPDNFFGKWSNTQTEGSYKIIRTLSLDAPCNIREQIVAAGFTALDAEYTCKSAEDGTDLIFIMTLTTVHQQYASRYYQAGDTLRCRAAHSEDNSISPELRLACEEFGSTSFPSELDQAVTYKENL